MPELISEQALVNELNHFRYILTSYDFSEIGNVIFFDIESLNCYLKTHEDNPFERQYREIEEVLSKLSPYLPSSIGQDTMEVLSDILDASYCNMDLLKEHLLFNIKLDFIERVKSIQTENEWLELISLCKQIRTEQLAKLENEVHV